MTEKELQLLGFRKQSISAEESGDRPYHYYIYEITKGLEFISSDSDVSEDNNWFVEFFNTEIPVRFNKMEQVQSLINIFEKAKIIK
jgi:hypothetical protein